MNAGDPLDWYREIPIISRAYFTLAFLTTAACALEIVSPLTLYFNYSLIFEKGQIWRLFTNYLFFGMFSLDFLFHMYFLVRYCRLLEENSFRGRTMDFLAFIIFGMVLMTLVAPFVNIPFFGSSLTFMMVYIWGRRNEHVRMSFLGLFPFSAPYLPWVLFTFSLVLGNSATVDLIGIIVGHLYFYFDDIYPSVAEIRGWTPKRYLRVSTYFPPQEEEIRVDTENLEQISGVNERPLDNIQPAPQTQEDINNENYNDTEEVTQQVQINDLQNVTSEQNRIEDSVDNTIIQDNQPQTEATESEVRDNSLDIDTVRSTQLGIENDNVESRENNIRHRRPFDSSSD